MDQNLFWNRLTFLVGDAMFSSKFNRCELQIDVADRAPFPPFSLVPCHVIAETLRRESSKKVFRHNIMLRNPFLGSPLYQVQGHHFVELAYVFMTFLERLPRELDRETSKEFGRRWIAFANNKKPWTEYRNLGSIAIVDSQNGWTCVSANEDIAVSGEIEEGRRYKQWELLYEVLSKAQASGARGGYCLDISNVMGILHS